MDHCFEQAIFTALVCVAMKMQQQDSVCWLSIYLCVNLCSVLGYLNVDKGGLVINRKLHRKRQAEVEAINSSEKINCSVGAGHSDQGNISISLV